MLSFHLMQINSHYRKRIKQMFNISMFLMQIEFAFINMLTYLTSSIPIWMHLQFAVYICVNKA